MPQLRQMFALIQQGGWLAMQAGLERLSDREREALRLLGRGHDAKSIAMDLGLSVHTINERLRIARRKLGVSSSREAARMLVAHEVATTIPQNLVHKKIGVAAASTDSSNASPAHGGAAVATSWRDLLVMGAAMTVLLGAILLIVDAGGHDASLNVTDLRSGQPTVPIPMLFGVSDYPADALAKKVQGTAAFRLNIDSDGHVEKCDIERSSGSAALDEATCNVIVKRSRFHPAIKDGRRVNTTYVGAIKWVL